MGAPCLVLFPASLSFRHASLGGFGGFFLPTSQTGGWKERNWRREAELPFRGRLRDRGAGVDAGRRAGLPLTPPAKPWPSVPRCWPAETAWAGQQHLLSQSDYAGRVPGAGTVCDLLGWSTTPARGAESQGETRQSYRPGPWRQPSSRRAG